MTTFWESQVRSHKVGECPCGNDHQVGAFAGPTLRLRLCCLGLCGQDCTSSYLDCTVFCQDSVCSLDFEDYICLKVYPLDFVTAYALGYMMVFWDA